MSGEAPRLPSSAEEFIAAAGWTFAKSMPTIPHFYTVRGKHTGGVDPPPVEWHDWFVAFIAEHGYLAQWGRRTFTYLHVGPWKYWAIHPVINRERLPDADDDPPDDA